MRRVQTIPGVSEVRIWGEKRYSMRLWMDPGKLSAYGLTPLDVRQAIDRENIELPSGRIEGFNTELSVRTMSRLETPNQFNDLILKDDGISVVRFSDVGVAMLGAENQRTVLKRDGVQMVGVVLIPQPGANNVAIADEFYNRLESIQQDLPEDIQLAIGFDVTEYIRESISEVQQTVVIAFILVVLIIFLFLRDWRTTIIPTLVIPIALIGAFFVMFIAGFSINVLTMLGIVLAIGLVVDDAIVVMENIYAKIEQGMEPVEAAVSGCCRDFLCSDFNNNGAGCGIPAGNFPGRTYRSAVPGIWYRSGRFGNYFLFCCAYPFSDALQQDSEKTGTPQRYLSGYGAIFSGP